MHTVEQIKAAQEWLATQRAVNTHTLRVVSGALEVAMAQAVQPATGLNAEVVLIFWYKNHRGEETTRRVRPISIRFGTSEWHKEPQWLMLAHDTEKDRQREFAMRDMSGFVGSTEVPVAQSEISGLKVGDWVTYEMCVGQIKELRGDGNASFTDGHFETSGRLLDRFRPLTMRGKNTVEAFHYYYRSLREIDGESGFNYPDIHNHFSDLALKAIDGDDDAAKVLYDQAQQFVINAREYTPQIQGVRLFRPRRVGR